MKNEWNVLWIDTSHTAPRDVRHISAPTAPPFKTPMWHKDSSQSCLFSIYFVNCCFFCLLNNLAHPLHPIRTLYLLATLFDLINLFIFTKGISTITLRHTALARKCYHNDCLSLGTNTTVLFNILQNGLAAAHLCIAI